MFLFDDDGCSYSYDGSEDDEVINSFFCGILEVKEGENVGTYYNDDSLSLKDKGGEKLVSGECLLVDKILLRRFSLF